MAWYARTVDTVNLDDSEETETDRMWRQIDPEIYFVVKQQVEQRDDSTPGA